MMGGGFISGALENWAADNEKSKLKVPKLDIDIYSAMLYGPDPAMNLGGVVMGTDKLGHFVDQGFSLFEEYLENDKSIEKTLQYSGGLEETFWPYSLSASGIKSYGD
jgi:hypothetical protein